MTGRWAIVSNHSPVARGRMCPREPLGVPGIILAQRLNLEIILPLVVRRKTPAALCRMCLRPHSSLPVSWVGAGVVWPGESGALLLSLGGKPFKMAFPRSTVGDSRPPENTPGSRGDGERRGRLRGGGYLTHAVGTRSPSCESNMVSAFDCGGHVLHV